jgi:hypothetical protein
MRGGCVIAALVFCGCASRLSSLHEEQPLSTELGTFEIQYATAALSDRPRIEAAIQHAVPRLLRWGMLRAPVRVYVLGTHAELERAVNRHGYGWLQAWARYEEVFIQAPHTWASFGPTQLEVDELALHELTHSLMYQLAADRSSWQRKAIPVWFREGMASYTAEQAYRRMSLEQLAHFYAGHPGEDPLVAEDETFYRTQSDAVYAAAHHAFDLLVKHYGEERVRKLLQKMREGARFPEAFEQAMGLSVVAFQKDFERPLSLWERVRVREKEGE